jgi:hypothetical protein
MDHLHELFGSFCSVADEVEARTMLAFCLVIGNHFLAADHGNRTAAKSSLAPNLLLERTHDDHGR